MPPKVNTRTQLTESIRVELCKMKESNPSWKQKDLVKWLEDTHGLKVSQATISKTLKRSVDLLQEEGLLNPNTKHSKMVKYLAMESALYECFVCHQEHVNMNGESLKEKGNIFLRKLYPEATSFGFSNGWLEKFKQRHAIHSFRRFGESGSVNMEKIEASFPSIREELDKWAWKDIYNMDETDLFYQMQADNSLATKQLEGGKQNKERITIVICCNGDDSDKLSLWVIGKFLNPRCFNNVNRDNLNCKYRANSNAWMTSLFFMEWLKWFDSRLGRNVLLILDNCTAHGKKENLPPLHPTTVMFLPPTSTSKIQSCDVGRHY
ncbi:CENP-B homolog protein 2-like [Pistacia vera]|uniref:CENP-B homolog protein 2-like n=1 Tax=Pistacia vera TaxID=55513 RepID=UPI0012632A10|nr:CENP-B homolog protein 2-like [Pistacia vera]